MRPPRCRAARSRARVMAQTDHLLRLLDLLDLLDQLDVIDELDMEHEIKPNIRRRRALLTRTRRPWPEYIRPMLGDNNFTDLFRMEHDDFMALVELPRPALHRDAKMGALRSGAMPVEYQLAIALRWLAGESNYEGGMDGHVIARSTTYAIVHRVNNILNACSRLDGKWPVGADAFLSAALLKRRSEPGIIGKALRAMDGLFMRLIRPTRRDHGVSHNFYSGQKKGHRINLQVGTRALDSYP